MPEFLRESAIPVPAGELGAWHERPGAFERLAPPWQAIRVLERDGTVHDGDRLLMELRSGPLKQQWEARHRDHVPQRQFVDEQVRGPFARWTHTHRFEPAGEAASMLVDRIDYAVPGGAVGRFLGGPAVEAMLDRMFRFRHLRTRLDLVRHHGAAAGPLKVAVTGASGLVGTALCAFLATGGHRVYRLVRRPPAPGADEIRWDPAAGEIDAAALEGMDAVVHLAGENVAGGRWTDARKQRIHRSRSDGTRLLAQALAGLEQPPAVLVSASGKDIYGDRGAAWLHEDEPAGEGFLPRVCVDWEAAADPARAAGIRVVHPRIGMVLAAGGGALGAMLPLFRLGLGGPLGRGRQWVSWIALEDLVGLIHHAIVHPGMDGPYNAVAPNPVTNAEFSRILGKVLRRPAMLPAPAPALRLALGRQMADEMLLGGNRLSAERLVKAGFDHALPDLETALRYELGRFGPRFVLSDPDSRLPAAT